MAGLVKNALGEAVTKPESTDMYQVLQKITKRYTRELTLGRARTITKNEKMKGSGPIQVSTLTITVITGTAVMYL